MTRVFCVAAAVCLLTGAVLIRPGEPFEPIALQWARRGEAPPETVAVLIELGSADQEETDWSGRATVRGGRLAAAYPYCFRGDDHLNAVSDEQGVLAAIHWTARSHRPARWGDAFGPEPIYPPGVVLEILAAEGEDAVVHLETPAGAADVPLADVAAGEPVALLDGRATARLTGAIAQITEGRPTEDDFPAACLGPDGTLYVVYTSYTHGFEALRRPAAGITEMPDSFAELAEPPGGDRLWIRSFSAGRWSEPHALIDQSHDLCRAAVAADASGEVWIAYSERREHDFNIFLHAGVTPNLADFELQLTTDAGPDLAPTMTTDQQGNVWVAWQAFRDGKAHIQCAVISRDREQGVVFGEPFTVSSGDGNCWDPALAAGPGGDVAIAWDQYREGDYDTIVRVGNAEVPPEQWRQGIVVAGSARFEARPSLTYDTAGRLWIAYEEGPERWGKDYGALDQGDGRGLYHGHQVRVVCLEGAARDEPGALVQPAAELPVAQAEETNRHVDGPQYSHPRLGLDLDGNVWLVYREVFGRRFSTEVGAYWQSFARRLEGERWSEPILLFRSDGLLDNRPALLPRAGGGVWIVYNGDARFQAPRELGNEVFAAALGLPGEPAEPVLVAAEPGPPKDRQLAVAEARDVAAIRAYRIEAGGRTYRLLRGEFHRHTDFSWDGRPDGSITDMFRYGIDAAAMDWIGNGDHDNGAGREYPWWLTQKLTDAYHTGEHFIPMFTYERSVSYPHGHRNAMFAQRGVRPLPRLMEMTAAGESRVSDHDTQMFYRYLHEFGGICASHTSATGMGTDWRDNDPAVEPVVEIYQGDRQSYEYEGAPRSAVEGNTIGGYRPAGFVIHALQRGYRLGFQASSDHWSTHISYCVVLAEAPTREAILDALRRRHCYGATDNIILDVRAPTPERRWSGEHLMGDEFATRDAPQLSIHIEGTAALATVEILRDSQVVHTYEPAADEPPTDGQAADDQAAQPPPSPLGERGGGEGEDGGQRVFDAAWTDPDPQPGLHYYYVRVIQTNDETAWCSPMWIDLGPR